MTITESVAAASLAEREAECGACKHSPAYHDGEDGRACRAWDPETHDTKCECQGWTPPKPKFVPSPSVEVF